MTYIDRTLDWVCEYVDGVDRDGEENLPAVQHRSTEVDQMEDEDQPYGRSYGPDRGRGGRSTKREAQNTKHVREIPGSAGKNPEYWKCYNLGSTAPVWH